MKVSNARFRCSDVTTICLSLSSSRLEYEIASFDGSGGSVTSFVAGVFLVVEVFFDDAVVADADFFFFVAGAAVASAAHVAFCFIFVAGLAAAGFAAGPGDDTGAVPCVVGTESPYTPRVDIYSMAAPSLALFLSVIFSAPFPSTKI